MLQEATWNLYKAGRHRDGHALAYAAACRALATAFSFRNIHALTPDGVKRIDGHTVFRNG